MYYFGKILPQVKQCIRAGHQRMYASVLYNYLLLLFFNKHIFADSAEGASKIFGKVFEFRSCGYSVFGVAYGFVVYPSARFAHILFHTSLSSVFFYSIGSKSAAPCLHNGHTKSSGSSSPSYTYPHILHTYPFFPSVFGFGFTFS